MAIPSLAAGHLFPKKGPVLHPRHRLLLARFGPRPFPAGGVRKGCKGSALAERKNSARDAKVIELLPLVKRMAQQMRDHLPPHIEVSDLVGAGVLGLIDAIRKFDGSLHVRIESYARHRIRGAILDELRSLDSASRDMRKKNKMAEKVYRDLEARLGRPVSDVELAQALGVSLNDWYRSIRDLQALGMDWLRPMGSVGTKPPGQPTSIPAKQDDPFDLCYRREQKEILNRALACLAERERRMMWLYYDRGLNMKQIGEKLAIDESRVSQLHSATLDRLRSSVRVILQRPKPCVPLAAGAPYLDSASGDSLSPCQSSPGT